MCTNSSKIRKISHISLAFTLVFYQIFIPLAVVKASTEEPSQTNDNSTVQDNSNKNENSNDNKDEKKETESQNSCDIKNSDIPKACMEHMKCESFNACLKENSCSEIKKCIDDPPKENNNANINENTNSNSNSGNNNVNQNVNENTNSNSNGNENSNLNDNSDNLNSNNNENENSNENNNENINENSNENNNDNSAIGTGDAAAQSNTYTETNTNITSNNAQETVINIEGTSNEDINLLDQFQNLQDNDNKAPVPDGNVVVTNNNDAEITNNIEVSADSGNNDVNSEGNGNTAALQTGDATAVGNAVNVVNTNIVGNNVLFAVINVYGEWNGDLIVPGEGLLTVSEEPSYTQTVIINENTANITDNVNTEANSGNNAVNQEGTGNTAQINSGEATADSEVVTIANTNVVRNNYFFLLINNLGSWTGKILNWNKDDNTYTNVFSYDFGILPDGVTPTVEGILAIFNKNEADVENNVTVSANSGGNNINMEGDGSSATINTGNATAAAKIINFINTNIIGNNWLFAIVNIMGKWNGNAVFAYPDLAISLDDGKERVNPGENLDYKITYKNIGKAPCENVNILVSLPKYVESSGPLTYSLPGLKPGEEKSFTLLAHVSNNNLPGGTTSLDAAAGITTKTKEVELSNNMSQDSTSVINEILSPAGVEIGNNNPKLTITRKINNKHINSGKTLTYSIFVQNTGDVPLYNVVAFDSMKLKSTLVGSYAWSLGELKPGVKMRIQYKLNLKKNIPSGTYVNSASGYGFEENGNKISAKRASEKIAIDGLENKLVYQETRQNSYSISYFTKYVTIGGMCYLDHWPALDMVNQAQAAGPETAPNDNNDAQPLWPWSVLSLIPISAIWFIIRKTII